MQAPDRYLVTGARGMLGQAVVAEILGRGLTVTPTDLPETDLTDPVAARRLFDTVRPTRVIHCAAYTAVDRAEAEPDVCQRVNVEMPRIVARACAESGAAMLAVSTDFVFDGAQAPRPYGEDDAPRPLSVYGQTKLDGERAVAAELERYQIVRTAWLYGPTGQDLLFARPISQETAPAGVFDSVRRNFVSAMLDRLRRGERVRVVADQTGSPTCTLDLAPVLVDLAALCSASRATTGLFHAVNAGQTTWHGLTARTAELAGFDTGLVEAIPTSGYPTAARRPAWSVLGCARARALGVMAPLRPWQDALAEYVAILTRRRAE